MNAAELDEIKRKVAELVRDDLYERFPAGFTFDPIRVYSRTDHTGEDYLKVFVIYDGNTEDLDPALTYGIITRMRPKFRDLDINDYLSVGFVEKSEWDSLSEVPYA